MDDHLLRLFKVELKSQCEFAALAVQDLNVALAQGDTVQIWHALQEFLLDAANASKLLWGPSEGEGIAEMREALREFAGVDDDSPLKSRRVRNGFEHFDEKLIKWFQAGDTNVFVSRNVGPLDAIAIGGSPPKHTFGNFDPSTGIVIFLDRSVSIPDLIDELARISQHFVIE